MNLFSRFKKDYFNYLISIILPALISGLSIPVFKHLLGAAGYGKYSIWLNAVLIITAILSGWIAQSIIRFSPASKNVSHFSKQAFSLALITLSIFSIPVLLGIWYFSHDILLAILSVLTLAATVLQFTVLPIAQSGFHSKKIIFSEIIRVLSYMTIAIILLMLSGINYLYALFISVFISYVLSVIFLVKQTTVFFSAKNINSEDPPTIKDLAKHFFKYGAPLSLWFVFAYLLTYIDKLFMLKYEGAMVQGNYQAMFDLLSRSITIFISPVVTSIFPLLTSSYEKGNRAEIRKLLTKIISFEIGGLIVAGVLYWWFGSELVSLILKTPHTFEYKLMGLIIIVATFIWQIGILIQKRFELQLKSRFLLFMVFIAFLSQILLYLIFSKYNNPLLYPFGFLISAIVYVLLISFSEITFRVSSFFKLRGRYGFKQ